MLTGYSLLNMLLADVCEPKRDIVAVRVGAGVTRFDVSDHNGNCRCLPCSPKSPTGPRITYCAGRGMLVTRSADRNHVVGADFQPRIADPPRDSKLDIFYCLGREGERVHTRLVGRFRNERKLRIVPLRKVPGRIRRRYYSALTDDYHQPKFPQCHEV